MEAIPTVGEVLVTRTELPDQFGYQWAVTFLNSEYYTGVPTSQLFNVPLLMLANTDNTPVASYNASVYSANGNPSTFTGSGAAVVASRLVAAMAGYEQQTVVFATANNGTLQVPHPTPYPFLFFPLPPLLSLAYRRCG